MGEWKGATANTLWSGVVSVSMDLEWHVDVLAVKVRGPMVAEEAVPPGATVRFAAAEKWKVRLTVMSGPDFRTPHRVLGAIYPDRESAEGAAWAVADALKAAPPRLEAGRVVVDVPLPDVREGESYQEVEG